MAKNYVGVNLDFSGWEIIKARVEVLTAGNPQGGNPNNYDFNSANGATCYNIAGRRVGMLGQYNDNLYYYGVVSTIPTTVYGWEKLATISEVERLIGDINTEIGDIEDDLADKADTNKLSLIDDTTNKQIKIAYNGTAITGQLGFDYTKFVRDSFLKSVELVIATEQNPITIGGTTYRNGERFLKFVFKTIDRSDATSGQINVPGAGGTDATITNAQVAGTVPDEETVYINISDLVDIYTEGNGIAITRVTTAPNSSTVSIKVDVNSSGTPVDIGNVEDIPVTAAGDATFIETTSNGLKTSDKLADILISHASDILALQNAGLQDENNAKLKTYFTNITSVKYRASVNPGTVVIDLWHTLGYDDYARDASVTYITGKEFHLYNNTNDLGPIDVNVTHSSRTSGSTTIPTAVVTWNVADIVTLPDGTIVDTTAANNLYVKGGVSYAAYTPAQ